MTTKTIEERLEIKSWDEKPYREGPDGTKFTRAEVVLGGGEGGLESGTFEGLMYYAADGTSTYVLLMQLTATLDGRSGTFVARGEGGFDGSTARSECAILPGSGTGELSGISGTVTSSSTSADYPHMPLTVTYDLE